jgi:hypothetical protein
VFLPPISPWQQRHLAFISEFIVQMLYLPGLKHVVADFFIPPTPPPKPSGTVATTTAEDPIDFEAMAAEQNRCAETEHLFAVHPSKLHFGMQAFNALLATSLQAFFAQLSLKS